MSRCAHCVLWTTVWSGLWVGRSVEVLRRVAPSRAAPVLTSVRSVEGCCIPLGFVSYKIVRHVGISTTLDGDYCGALLIAAGTPS